MAMAYAPTGLAAARQIQGKELSYNNINDADAALECVSEFERKRCGLRHRQACQSLRRRLGCLPGRGLCQGLALRSDERFWRHRAFNRAIDAEAAREIVKLFTEVIIAPDATPEARDIIAAKKNLRLLLVDPLPDPKAATQLFKSVSGGFLVQSRDATVLDRDYTEDRHPPPPTETQMDDLIFAFTVAKHVKSNAIVYAKNGATVGIGAGQMSRVDSSRIAASKKCRGRDGARHRGAAHARLGRCLRRLLPLCRRLACGDCRRRHCSHPAGRLDQ